MKKPFNFISGKTILPRVVLLSLLCGILFIPFNFSSKLDNIVVVEAQSTILNCLPIEQVGSCVPPSVRVGNDCCVPEVITRDTPVTIPSTPEMPFAMLQLMLGGLAGMVPLVRARFVNLLKRS